MKDRLPSFSLRDWTWAPPHPTNKVETIQSHRIGPVCQMTTSASSRFVLKFLSTLAACRTRSTGAALSASPSPIRRVWSTSVLACWLSCVSACGGATSEIRSGEPAQKQAPAPVHADPAPEVLSLERVGHGASQMKRTCASGAKDAVAQALCSESARSIESLEDLYRALRLSPADQRLVAATTHSLAVSGRIVSAANPRVMVFTNTNLPGDPVPYDRIVATAFSRGQQLVELVGLDPVTYEYNFYLLKFEQACNGSRCSPEDLLTRRIESGWTDFTLYSDRDLEDTPLDCSTCHLPFGRGTHKLLLMRQVTDPWMHWGDFRGEERLCRQSATGQAPPDTTALADGLDLLRKLEGDDGAYAGIPVRELWAAKSGDAMSDFLVDAENIINTSPYPAHPYQQLFSLRTRETLCERLRDGASPSWEEDRLRAQQSGFPFPYYGPDVLDPKRRSELIAGRDALLERERDRDPFDVAASLLAEEAAGAAGFSAREQDTAPEILRGMCSRCHSAGVDARLARARFNVQALEQGVDPATFRTIRDRLRLPPSAPAAMPPRGAGQLPPWAVERVVQYMEERCSEPGSCR